MAKDNHGRGRPVLFLGVALSAFALAWAVMGLRTRARLSLENHLARNLPLPFQPVGRPAVHPDGTMFVVTAQKQFVAMSPKGTILWNKGLPGPVVPQPVVVSSTLVVLQGVGGAMYGYSLGGELKFTVEDGGDEGSLPCADDRGALYLMDRRGALAGFLADGQAGFRTSLGLTRDRQVVIAATGQLLGMGSDEKGRHEVFLAERSGLVGTRLSLEAAPVGLSISPRGGEVGAVSSGAEVVALDRAGVVTRRLALPGAARSAPLLMADGAVYVLVQRGASVDLCRAGGGCTAALEAGQDGAGAGLIAGPLLGQDGRIYTAFSSGGRFSAMHQGVLSVQPDGRVFRQELPGAVALSGLTLQWGGGVVAIASGERYLWLLEGGTEGDHSWHPWPMPGGNPAGSSRPWPEHP